MRHSFTVNGELEIYKDGYCFLNHKRITLLKMINAKGSINLASKEMKMSYQQAWHFVKVMNELSPIPLVIRSRGGERGGGTKLTKFAETTIRNFEKLAEEHKKFREQAASSLWLCFF
jgi:molybdate transport system regulatory protein